MRGWIIQSELVSARPGVAESSDLDRGDESWDCSSTRNSCHFLAWPTQVESFFVSLQHEGYSVYPGCLTVMLHSRFYFFPQRASKHEPGFRTVRRSSTSTWGLKETSKSEAQPGHVEQGFRAFRRSSTSTWGLKETSKGKAQPSHMEQEFGNIRRSSTSTWGLKETSKGQGGLGYSGICRV